MLKPSLLIALLSLGTVLQGAQPTNKTSQNENCAPGPRHMRAAVRHIEAGGVGYNKGYSTLEAFIASDPNQWCVMPFLDLRGHVFNDGKMAANAGLGARSIWGCRAYGINAYYDYRNTHHRGYNQVSVGLETLGKLWDLRVNGYLPVGGKVSKPYHVGFAGFSGNSILVDRKFQYAMKGIDGEIGFHFGKTSDFDFYGAAGPYYFKGEMGKGAIGGKVRLAGYYKEYLTLEVSDSFDNVFHNNVQGQLTLTLPFGPKSKLKVTGKNCPNTCEFASMLATRMLQPVNRQEIVVVDTHTKKEATSDFVIFVDNESHSAGTFESPYATLADAEANSSPGDIIYVVPGDGTTTGMKDGISLKDNQKLWGSGNSHTLTTNLGTITIPNYSASMPAIQNTSGNGVTLAKNNEISGMLIRECDTDHIFGNDPGNVSILYSTLINTTSSYTVELYFQNSSGSVFVDHLSLLGGYNGANEGLYVETDNSTSALITVINSTFSGTSYPIDFENFNSSSMTINVQNNIFSGNQNSIYYYSSSASPLTQTYNFSQNIVTGTNDDNSLYFQTAGTSPSNATFSNNDFIANLDSAAFYIGSTNASSLNFYNNRFDNTDDDSAVFFDNQGTLVSNIHNNSFDNNDGYGLYLFQESAQSCCFDIRGNTGSGNSPANYFMQRNTGTFNVSPCNAADLNAGGLFDHTVGTITHVESCPSGAECPP
jgi:hypothetical protein